MDLGTFEGWLQLSIDHVVPQQMVRAGYLRHWVEDLINIVAACGACNGLFNRDPAVGALPATLEEFLSIRDALFVTRKARILERRSVEREWFRVNVQPRASR